MGDPTVKMVFSGNSADAERAITSLEKKYEHLEQKLKNTNRAAKQSEVTNPFAGWAQNARAAVASLASVGTAVQTLTQAFEDLKQRNREAFETQKTVAGALEGMAINIDIPLAQAEAEAKRISAKSGVPLERIMASIGTAFSAKGQLGTKDAISAVETTATLIPNLLEAQDILTGATLDVRKFAPQLSNEQAQGFLMRAMVQARVTSLASMAEHGAPAITGMAMLDRENKDALAQAAGIYGAITQGLRDPHGRKARTAGTALLIQAREFLGGDEVAGLSNEQILDAIAQDREAFNAFFKGGDFKGKKRKGLQMTITGPDGQELSVAADRASFERQAVPVLMSMLTPGTEEYKNWKTATAAMGNIATADKDYLQKKQELAASGIKQVVDFSNRGEAAAATTRVEDVLAGGRHSAREVLNRNLGAANIALFDRFMAARQFDISQMLGEDPQMAAIRIQREQVQWAREAGGSPFETDEQRRMMNEQLDRLDRLIDLQEQQLNEQRKRPPPNPQGQRE